jgi:glyoxalase family protein
MDTPAPRILGLHHLTATVNRAQDDLDFYTGVLGLRLVKQTVNFDNPKVYHFYYGDGSGTPSTLMTTFPYGLEGVRQGVQGAGQITTTAFSVPTGSLPGWTARLEEARIPFEREADPFGTPTVVIRDPSGLRLALVASEGDAREPWLGLPGGGAPDLGAGLAIRGLTGPTLAVRDVERSERFARELLGLEVVSRAGAHVRLGAPGAGGAPGSFLDFAPAPSSLPDAVNGLGTVHHAALAVADASVQLAFRERLLDGGANVTEVKDRKYFQSIYFREPGGVLYEIATLGPGFTVDEADAELGRNLRVPDPVAHRHDEIARQLEPITLPEH